MNFFDYEYTMKCDKIESDLLVETLFLKKQNNEHR